jgi:hypothetical protein
MLSYMALNGLMTVENVTFSHFKQQCNGSRAYVLVSNPRNEDGQHEVEFRQISLFEVDYESKVFIHRPDLAKINPTDCIDMNCDGLKKNLLTDLDGTFLTRPGTVISQSEFEWGSQSRGLGDFRIPKEALSDERGHMRNISTVYTYRGIVRDENTCTYVESWQAYECFHLKHKLLVIESMDNDTETRRLAPVAIFSDDNKYVDLMNGPEDHGWCFGYPCMLRASTFFAIVAANKNFDVYLTSTPPFKLRFRILNANSSYKIRMSMYYFTSNRIDVYKNNIFVKPTNGIYQNNKLILNVPNMPAMKPTHQNESGTNLNYRPDRKVYFTLAGGDYIDLIITQTITIKFGLPSISEQSFFDEENLVQNFANLLGIEPSKIRIVQIVSEMTRKRRSTEIKIVTIEISENPVIDSSNQNEIDTVNTKLKQLEVKLVNQFITGELQNMAKSIFSNPSAELVAMFVQSQNETEKEVKHIGNILIVREASGCRAQSPCDQQPILKIVDENVNNLD